ncbi:MAG: hypoxanthine phosphoribosyltransferase [Deltaproteobacteria bacterium]|nr:hypoxanthine phosphoribosyltransferase [Deltaproteobacteria bacterium]
MQKPHLKSIISHTKIRQAVQKLASEIRKDYSDKNPVLIGILKGSFVFLSDIARELNIPLKIDFIRAASYGSKDYSGGAVEMIKDIEMYVEGKDVLIVEDIVDTGLTIHFVINHLKEKMPASIKICSLLDKPSKRKVDVRVDYKGFTLDKDIGFVVGYGLDFNEEYRYLKDIYELKPAFSL